MLSTYLTNRKQYVQFEFFCSEMLDTQYGVPQGSILGPLLFVIYINDFQNASKVFQLIMYADDHNIYIQFNYITNSTSLFKHKYN